MLTTDGRAPRGAWQTTEFPLNSGFEVWDCDLDPIRDSFADAVFRPSKQKVEVAGGRGGHPVSMLAMSYPRLQVRHGPIADRIS